MTRTLAHRKHILTVNTSCTSSINNTPELLISEVGPSSFRTRVRALDMHSNDLVKLSIRHVLEPADPISTLVNYFTRT